MNSMMTTPAGIDTMLDSFGKVFDYGTDKAVGILNLATQHPLLVTFLGISMILICVAVYRHLRG